MQITMGNLITAIDFGSSKIAVAVGEKTAAGIRILSCNSAPAAGIRGGEIINDRKVMEALSPLLRKAEDECGERIDSAVISLSGKFIRSKEVSARSVRKEYDKYIAEDEIKSLSAELFDKETGPDEMVFEVIPQKFNVDDQIGLGPNEVLGMRGHEIEGFFKLFYGKEKMFTSRKRILGECGISVRKFVLSPVASAAAVLTRQEMENGVALVDIGKGLTEVAVIKDNIVRELSTIPFAGESVTNDIKLVTNLTGDWSERVKLRFGNCLEEYTPENKQLVLRGEDNIEEGSVELSLLSRIIESRMSEILEAVEYVIAGSGYGDSLPSGIVMTGGTAYMEHLMQLAKVLLGRKVRLAAPRSSVTADSAMGSFNADASTVVGLVIEGISGKLSYTKNKPDVASGPKRNGPRALGSIFDGLFGGEDGEEDDTREKESAEKAEEKRRKKEAEEKRKEDERIRKEEERRRRIEEQLAREQEEKDRKAMEKAEAGKSGKEPKGGKINFGGFFSDLFAEENDKA